MFAPTSSEHNLSLLQSILVPALHYGCEIWGMHTPTGEAKAARAALQSIYDRLLRRICGVRHMPSAMLLGELALSPLQVFWWQQTLEFWNMIAANPVGSLFHTILLGNMLFMWGVVLRIFLLPLQLACSLLGIPCLVLAMLFL